MPILEGLIQQVAKKTVFDLIGWGYKNVTKVNSSKFISELSNVIYLTIGIYEKKFFIQETDKIPFYKSQTLLNEFLNFRFTRILDRKKIIEAIEEDEKIIAPTADEINHFFEIFDEEVAKNSSLRVLEIEENFKEEVFEISAFLKSFHDNVMDSLKEIKREFEKKNISAELLEEWNFQLDEIFEHIKCFKAYTAKERLENLAQRIYEQSIVSDKLYAKLYYLKAECLDQIGSTVAQEERSKLLIKAYRLQPNNLDLKVKAALGYHYLGESERAKALTDEILLYDEFNISGWVLKCLLAENNFEEIFHTVPIKVKSKNLFKVNLYHWLLNRHLIAGLEDLEKYGLFLTVEIGSIPSFSYKNMKYLHLVAQNLLNIYYASHPEITSELKFESAVSSNEYHHAYEILRASSANLIGSEIESSYFYFQFQFYCCSFILNKNVESIHDMEDVYKRMIVKTPDVVLRMMQGYNSLNTEEAYLKAIDEGERYEGAFNDAIYLFLAGTYGFISEEEKQTQSLIKYIELKPAIDKPFFLNLISFIRFNRVLITDKLRDSIKEALSNKPVVKPEYLSLLKVFCFCNLKVGAYAVEEISTLIEDAKNVVDVDEAEVSFQVALAYCYSKQEEKAKLYLQGFVDKGKPSETLKFYCKVLYNGTGDKIELLEILDKWRSNFDADYELLQIEFELRRIQGKWDEAIKVCKYAIENFPSSEYFIDALFISLNNDMQFDEIKNNFRIVEQRVFKYEHIAANVAKALLRAGMYSESLELLYSHASKKENQECRREFAVLFIKYPEELFSDIETVDGDCFVKYEIDNSQNVIQITAENKNDTPNRLFLHKKVGETFTVPRKFSDVISTVTVVQILNKYSFLLQELLREAEDPLNDHLIQSFKFKDDSVEAINDSFIENFGVRGSLQKQRSEEFLKQYYLGQLSFSEITNAVFDREFVDCYFILTNQTGKPFKAISPSINRQVVLGKETKFALDFTSICLFYQLTKEKGIFFSNKFYVSHLIRKEIADKLENAKSNPKSEFSITVTTDRVIPHFLDPEFNTRRINTFQTLLEWVDNNCTLLDVPERLNFVTGSDRSLERLDAFMNILIDCRLIVDNENYVLLTNDSFYYRQLSGGINNILSPIHFLEKYHADKTDSYIGFMIDHNFVGIPITSSILNEQFYKMLSGTRNSFSICLENLRFNWNPEVKHIHEAIKFIKELYVSAFVNDSVREQTTLAVFQNLVIGMELKLLEATAKLIKGEFRLLDVARINVLQLFTLAIRR